MYSVKETSQVILVATQTLLNLKLLSKTRPIYTLFLNMQKMEVLQVCLSSSKFYLQLFLNTTLQKL